MAKGTRNKGGGGTTTNKEVNKENHKNIADNRQQNNSTDHPSNVKGGGRPHRNKQKIVVSIKICTTQRCTHKSCLYPTMYEIDLFLVLNF